MSGNLAGPGSLRNLRMCIDQALRRGKSLFLNGGNFSKAFDSPERAIKDIAPRRLGARESVVEFLVSVDEKNEVHVMFFFF